MSREIKFRAWLIEEEEYADVSELIFEDNKLIGAILGSEHEGIIEYIDNYPRTESHGYWEIDQFILEQYIKKDKYGEETYEGDIMKYYDGCVNRGDNPHKRCVAKWSKKNCGFAGIFRGTVIGNIHENPELLETK